MRASFQILAFLSLNLGLGLGACKDKKKNDNNKTTQVADPCKGANPPATCSSPTPPPKDPAPGAIEEVSKTFNTKVAGKTWKLCRKWTATKSEIVQTTLKSDNSYSEIRSTYPSGNCSGNKIAGNESKKEGQFEIEGDGPKPDTWKYKLKLGDAATHFGIIGLANEKLFFGLADKDNPGTAEAGDEGRPDGLDMDEGYTASGEPGVSTKYLKKN